MVDSRRKIAADAWGALLQLHAALVPLLDKELRRQTGLPLAWYDVLLELSIAEQRRLPMSALGERVVLSRTRVSRIVDEMVAEGLLRKDGNPDDRRSAFATLTDEGLRRFRAAAPRYLASIERHFADGLSDDELATAREILLRVRSRTP